MTGNSDRITRHSLICVTFSGRGDQTAPASIKIAKISSLQDLMVPLLDSRNLASLKFWHHSGQARLMTGNSNPISRHNWIHVTYSGKGNRTADDSGKTIQISHLV